VQFDFFFQQNVSNFVLPLKKKSRETKSAVFDGIAGLKAQIIFSLEKGK